VTAIANMGWCERAAYDISFYGVEDYSENNMGVKYGLMINDHKILFISFFLYYIIVTKSIRTFEKENDGINSNKEISFCSSKRDL
jgi:hypothetical protein